MAIFDVSRAGRLLVAAGGPRKPRAELEPTGGPGGARADVCR